MLRAQEVTNVGFVWHASGFPSRDAIPISEWFPGAEFVDYCGVSFFQQPYECQIATECRINPVEELATFCRDGGSNIPIMIAESTPFGGILDDSVVSEDPRVIALNVKCDVVSVAHSHSIVYGTAN
jgi:hypothetical protein